MVPIVPGKIISTPVLFLAGGASARMGSPKGLLPFGRRTWLEEQLHRFSFSGAKAAIVLGHDHEKYFEALPFLKEALQLWIPWPGAKREELQLSVTINSRPELGPFSSLMRGLERFLPENDVFVLPIDTPVPVPEVWRSLELASREGAPEACIPEYAGKRGHPVWLSSKFIKTLHTVPTESPDARLDHQLAGLPQEQRRIVEAFDPKITWNINTPAEFAKLKEQLSREEIP